MQVSIRISKADEDKLAKALIASTKKHAVPSKVAYHNYLDAVARTYKAALRAQLKIKGFSAGLPSSQLGFASGELRRSIKAGYSTVKGKTGWRGNKKTDAVQFWSIRDLYGSYIAGGRKAGYIPISKLVSWIKQKIANNAWTNVAGKVNRSEVSSYKGKKGSGLKEFNAKRVAYAISAAASKKDKPAVIPYWDDYKKNRNLRADFKQKFKRNTSKYRTALIQSIIENLNEGKR